MDLPKIPDDDADFTPELGRKIIAQYQTMLRDAEAERIALERQLEEQPEYILRAFLRSVTRTPDDTLSAVTDISLLGRYDPEAEKAEYQKLFEEEVEHFMERMFADLGDHGDDELTQVAAN